MLYNKKCVVCGKEFIAKSHLKKYCNRECFLEFRRMIITGRKFCVICKKEIKYQKGKMRRHCCSLECKKEYRKTKYTNIPLFPGKFKGTWGSIYTNGVTKEIKERNIVEKIKNDVLNDCIKNPRKYLGDDEKCHTKTKKQ